MLAGLDMTDRRDVRTLLELLLQVAKDMGEEVPHLKMGALADHVATDETWIKQQADSFMAYKGFQRDAKWSTGWKRLLLHSQIVESLMTKPRPKDEEQICVQRGGALPRGGVQHGNTAFMVTGPPAAGKSRLSRPLAEKTRSAIVDPDDAKRMLPEYRNGLNAPPLHEESSLLAKGPNGMLDCAASCGMNIIMPTVGGDSHKLREVRDLLRNLGYRVYLVGIHCPAEIAAVRSLERLSRTGRYVPLGYLLGEVGDLPLEAYHRAKADGKWAGYALYDATEQGVDPKLVGHKNFDGYL